jgi:hypothetical protein
VLLEPRDPTCFKFFAQKTLPHQKMPGKLTIALGVLLVAMAAAEIYFAVASVDAAWDSHTSKRSKMVVSVNHPMTQQGS